jgi:hypothetical protein
MKYFLKTLFSFTYSKLLLENKIGFAFKKIFQKYLKNNFQFSFESISNIKNF